MAKTTKTTKTTTKQETLGGTKMKKNIFEQNLKAAAEAKVQEAAAKAKAAKLAEIKPHNIVETMDEIKNNEVHAYRDEEGNAGGVNGGAYIQVPDGMGGTIAAKTMQEVEVIKARIAQGVMGDGLLHKTIYLGGCRVECVGKTEKELAKDIEAAEICYRKHPKTMLRDVDVAEQLVDAQINPTSLEQVEVKGYTFLINYDMKAALELDGTVAVNLDNLSSKLSKADVKTLLLEKLEHVVVDRYEEDYDGDDNYDDEDEDDYDSYDEDEEDYDDGCDECEEEIRYIVKVVGGRNIGGGKNYEECCCIARTLSRGSDKTYAVIDAETGEVLYTC